MTELAFVLLFTAAGIGAALLALRLAGDSPLIRWLVRGFCLVALANLALHLWRVVAEDPGGAARAAGIAAGVAAMAWAYRRLLRAIRKKAERDGAARNGAGRNGAERGLARRRP